MNVVALISGLNVVDVVAQVIGAFVTDGVQVYFLDQGSTDGTGDEVERWQGRGVIGFERLGPPTGSGEATASVTRERVLARKEALALELDADWFLHSEADEFYESPWTPSLREGIGRVAERGYNAIAFRTFHFIPTPEDSATIGDVRVRHRHHQPAWTFGHNQITCWKKTPQPVSLRATGGESVQFPDRRIYPFRFLLRHYPIRSIASHAPAVPTGADAPSKAPPRAVGWTFYDDGLGLGIRYVPSHPSLARFDPVETRFDLLLNHRELERTLRLASASQGEAERLTDELATARSEVDTVRSEIEALHVRLAEKDKDTAAVASLTEELAGLRGDVDGLRARLLEREALVRQLMTSRSWKLTAPLRAVERLLRRAFPQ